MKIKVVDVQMRQTISDRILYLLKHLLFHNSFPTSDHQTLLLEKAAHVIGAKVANGEIFVVCGENRACAVFVVTILLLGGYVIVG